MFYINDKLNCVFLDRDSIDCNDLDFSQIESLTNFTLSPSNTRHEVAEKARDADIIIVNKIKKLGEVQFSALPRLKLVCVIATGTNNIDPDAGEKHVVLVRNVKDFAAASVSQHVFILIRHYQPDFWITRKISKPASGKLKIHSTC